ncbi:uncharacterized protein LOC122239320 [Panthera tigris]|uniref:uncharacterized protein LOC122239320 n=1 Tax=Panthera tigris TaxID=9694 RepID=UPI001C6FA37F|nr:uncharacterized protein LOC122239320 [Panthera tigris]
MRLSGAQAAKLLHADRGLLDALLPCVVPWIVTTEAKGESNFHWNPGRLLRRGDRCARCGRAGGNWRRMSKGPSSLAGCVRQPGKCRPSPCYGSRPPGAGNQTFGQPCLPLRGSREPGTNRQQGQVRGGFQHHGFTPPGRAGVRASLCLSLLLLGTLVSSPNPSLEIAVSLEAHLAGELGEAAHADPFGTPSSLDVNEPEVLFYKMRHLGN